jgi:hypothetical protein
MGHDHVGHGPQVGVEQAQHVLGRQVLGEPGEAAQVGQEQRHPPVLASQSRPLGRSQEPGNHLVAQVATEEGAHEPAAAGQVLGETVDLLVLAAQGELGLDPRQYHRQVERLGHVVVGATVQGLDHVLGRVACGGDDHGKVRAVPAPTHLLEHVQAAEPRHHQVQQHHVVAGFREPDQSRLSVLGGVDQVAALPQALRENLAVLFVVVDDQEPRPGGGGCGIAGGHGPGRGGRPHRDRRLRSSRRDHRRRFPGRQARLADRLLEVGRHRRVDAPQRVPGSGLDAAKVGQVAEVPPFEGLLLEQLRVAQDLVQGRPQVVPEPSAELGLGVAHAWPQSLPAAGGRRQPSTAAAAAERGRPAGRRPRTPFRRTASPGLCLGRLPSPTGTSSPCRSRRLPPRSRRPG